ncbi:hypothetical protein G3N96_31730 [Burkholderia sp. Se-20373]|uniref:hypothetical protein n=1 Tax=Burkholderia sp. Se-20373 TaxID=2703898 RepID=UPI00197DC35E|nr:hypothetical protein [Burkholderia sp. Se-20373]MBN3749959.1 hypothetical protein [Burkholderia sp. Se-20373]
MYSPAQSRVVSISGVALPEFSGQLILLPIKPLGDETLGKLSAVTLELSTLSLPALPVYKARDRIGLDKLLGSDLTISSAPDRPRPTCVPPVSYNGRASPPASAPLPPIPEFLLDFSP